MINSNEPDGLERLTEKQESSEHSLDLLPVAPMTKIKSTPVDGGYSKSDTLKVTISKNSIKKSQTFVHVKHKRRPITKKQRISEALKNFQKLEMLDRTKMPDEPS